jgi:hypothetical protein
MDDLQNPSDWPEDLDSEIHLEPAVLNWDPQTGSVSAPAEVVSAKRKDDSSSQVATRSSCVNRKASLPVVDWTADLTWLSLACPGSG